MRSVPVFMYHHVNWHFGDLVTLSPLDFENHLQVIAEKGIRTLFLEEVMAFLRGEKTFGEPAVALTFDDGHLDNWVYAYPLLKKYRARATIFVITSWMTEGEPRPIWDPEGPAAPLPEIPRHGETVRRAAAGDFSGGLRWSETREMEGSGLVDIQSHTHLHRDYFQKEGKGYRLDPKRRGHLAEDLSLSRERIETRLAKKCPFLSWPWGKYDDETIALARELGFAGLVTTEKGVNLPGSPGTAIKRVVAKSGGRRWFASRCRIYSHPLIGRIYPRIAGKI